MNLERAGRLVDRVVRDHLRPHRRTALARLFDVLDEVPTFGAGSVSLPSGAPGGQVTHQEERIMRMSVDDQDVALRFYTQVLGFARKPMSHLVNTMADDCLTSALDGVELLLQADGRPAVDSCREALTADGIPCASFAVVDVPTQVARLASHGVTVTLETLQMVPVTPAVLDDTDGSLLQMTGDPR
jgi:catechol 2,3-dioxygenase-like lactoylglutathione lyase family enzyme